MALFVSLLVDAALCASRPECRECVQVCPVDVFARLDGGTAEVIPENEDECILCDLCVARCPVEAVTLVKHY
ncbi:MAG: 4Fe-4S binding protein [Dehalococcoidia bacterium]